DFVNLDGITNSLHGNGRQFLASRGEVRVKSLQVAIGAVTDDDSPTPGNAFEAAGEVYFACKHGVVQDMRVRAHQADSDITGVDAGPERQQRQHRQWNLSGRFAGLIFAFSSLVLSRALQ